MAIRIDDSKKLFTLQTKNTTYQMQVGKCDVLLHLYYGKKVENDNLDYLIKPCDRGFSGNPCEAGDERGYSLDTLPQEFSGYGTSDFRLNSVAVSGENGSLSADFRYVSHMILDKKHEIPAMPSLYDNGSEAQTLAVVLEDKAAKLRVTLYYSVFEELDVITRAADITYLGEQEAVISKAMSLCLDLPYGNYDMLHFYGRHAMERQLERTPLMHGTRAIGSKRGASSHHHNPFVILCEREASEDYGECYGAALVYSGNFTAEVEVDQVDQTRFVMGIGSEYFSWTLKKNEVFHMPEAVLSYTDKGFTALSHIFHRAFRHNLCRGDYKLKRRPILINNWEATYFDFNKDKLVEIAKTAAELGVEMLVMDDGWFGKRDNDVSGLGDWFVNEKKLGSTLKELVDEVNGQGLKFGIWFEPEMISEDSELYKEHPEWVLRVPNKLPDRSRFQLVLDMSRDDVRDYLFASISSVLDSANIEYIKWDMNRSMSDVYSNALPAEKQGEASHRYMLGLYDLLEKITSKYPHVLLEGCSGGGGRFDAGMLYYSPQIWCSDNTDAIERIKIQYGTSFAYPISSVGSHVSASPNHQTGRHTPLKTRGVVAMAGSFGYELDLSKMTEEEKVCVKEQIEDFKKYYDVIQDGNYYRLTNPFENHYFSAWQFVSEDRSKALFNIVVTHVEGNARAVHCKLKGLNETSLYRINDRIYTGSALMHAGFVVDKEWSDYPAEQYYIEEVEKR
ncbi:alpha-galactosidase [Konateibacter massiliensis]|uniref:alpha-galactosidase n=1 Tax=Konateibacter massiliensis TaxID=2002841 RepID=UPI000C14D8DC|nr:alpha-galactosidase [Konateibacter massiliensis]